LASKAFKEPQSSLIKATQKSFVNTYKNLWSPLLSGDVLLHICMHIYSWTQCKRICSWTRTKSICKSEYLHELNTNTLAVKAHYFCVTYLHEFFHTCTYCDYILYPLFTSCCLCIQLWACSSWCSSKL